MVPVQLENIINNNLLLSVPWVPSQGSVKMQFDSTHNLFFSAKLENQEAARPDDDDLHTPQFLHLSLVIEHFPLNLLEPSLTVNLRGGRQSRTFSGIPGKTCHLCDSTTCSLASCVSQRGVDSFPSERWYTALRWQIQRTSSRLRPCGFFLCVSAVMVHVRRTK